MAFKKAFPNNSSKEGLVIKAMNADYKNKNWVKMMALIDSDPRIFIINKTMNRSEIIDLFGMD